MSSAASRRQPVSAVSPGAKQGQRLQAQDGAVRVPQLCSNKHLDSSSCWQCQHLMHSSQSTASATEPEQIVPQHARSGLQPQLQGKRRCVRHADAFHSTPWELQPAAAAAAAATSSAGFRRSHSASLCLSEAGPQSGRSSPAAVRPDSQSALHNRLTVPVAESGRQGRKRSLHRDSGSTTDLASFQEAAHASPQETLVSDTCSDLLPMLNSHSMDYFSLQQVPRYSLTGGSLLTGHQCKRRRSSSSEQEVELAGPGAVMQGPPACQQDQARESSDDADTTGTVPWLWQPSWASREVPVPARLVKIASIQRPYKQSIASDVLSSVEFSQDGMLLATAGRAKQVNVYSMASLDDEDSEVRCPQVAQHRMPSKLSSLAWSPCEPGMVTVGDYDGGVAQLDLSSGLFIGDREERDGRRLWSVAHSVLKPHLVASASDSGVIRLWGGRGLASCAGSIFPSQGAPTCGVAFSSLDEHLLAAASADTNAYVYDVRHTGQPLQVLQGHSNAVSFVRFLGRQLVTSSTDSTLGWWDLGHSKGDPVPHLQQPVQRLRTLTGHANAKNFVGLSVREQDRLIACGSEAGSAFVYHTSWDTPVANAPAMGRKAAKHSSSESSAQQALQQLQLRGQQEITSSSSDMQPPVSRLAQGHLGDNTGLVSAVAWRPIVSEWMPRAYLAAATSTGDLGLLSLEVFENMLQQ